MGLSDYCTCDHQNRHHNQWDGCVISTNGVTCSCKSFVPRFAVPEVDDDESLGGFLADLKAQMQELKAAFEPLKEEHSQAVQSVKALDEARKAAVAKAQSIESAMKNYQGLLENAERAAQLTERKILQAEAIKNAEAELRRLADVFDEITKNAPWRQWAYDFQVQDAKVMALGKRVIVGNTMGTGKTLLSQIACDMLKSERVLVFTPATVMRSFVNEIKRWAPHRNVMLLGGMDRQARRGAIIPLGIMKSMGQGFTVVLNYEAMRKDSSFIEDLKSLEFDTVILDEAHNFKDKKSLTFRQIKEIVIGDGHQPTNVFPMTGSPILNKPQDLWPLLHLISPFEFADEYTFLSQYCVQDWETGKWRFTSTGLTGLQRKLRDKFIRRTKDQTGIALPPKTIQVHDIDLSPVAHPKQYAANRDLNVQAAIFLGDEDDKALSITSVLALITRKRQMMTLPSGIKWTDNREDSPTFGKVVFECDVNESVKLDYIIHPNGDVDNPTWNDPGGLLPELVSDEKVVIFSQFKAPLHELRERCRSAGINAEIIDGDTPMAKRQDIIDTFQNKPIGAADGVDVILGNFKALGVGVTLTAASQMIVLDEEWNPGKNEQAYDRIHRFGQDKPVTIHILRVKDSIDDWMAGLIDEKADLVDGFNSTVDLSLELKRLLGRENE